MTTEQETPEALKADVRSFWDEAPCGTRDVVPPAEPDRDFFADLDERRYRLEPVADSARFEEHRGERLLEIGCGAGADLARFAAAGARVTGVDLSAGSIALARRRFEVFGLEGELLAADAESLPFDTASFDFVWSWGVLHHTPDTPGAVSEACRVLRPGGEACIMLYHRRSLFAAQAWLRYALARGKLGRSVADVLAEHVESPGTKAYTRREARAMFEAAGFADVRAEPVMTVWDARVGRRRFLPPRVRRMLPDAAGWFLVIRATKPV